MHADVLFGGSVNISSIQKGKTLNQGEVFNYEDISEDIFNSKINGILNGRLTYNFNDHFGITTGFQFQKILNNRSSEENVKMFPSIISWQLGISHSL